MKDLTVKWKNIEYSYSHGMDCLAKIATKELLKELPLNKPIELDAIYIDGYNFIKIVNTNFGIKVNKTKNMLNFEDDWNDLSSKEKLKIYFKVFNKLNL